MTRNLSTGRGGFTLLETLVIMMGLTVSMGMGTVLLLAAFKADGMGRATLNRLSAREALARQFREDVAAATARPERAGAHTASPHFLILERSPTHRVLYQWDDRTLHRIEQDGGKESRRPLPVGSPGTTVEFVPAAEGPRVVTVRLVERPGTRGERRSEIMAALGGGRK